MSKQGKRKITVELPKTKDLANRPSVFERLGTKKTSSASAKKLTEYCRQWAQHGTCAYGKGCKFATTHTLISPSKQRAANKDGDHKRILKDDAKSRLHSTVVVRSGRSPDGEIDNWDQNDLEYADTDVLEKRRQQLQRELELQLKMDSNKDMRKDKKKVVSSSSSSRSSSSSSVSSSSSDGSSSSSSSGRDIKRKTKKGKLKRNSSSSSDGDVPKKKLMKTDSLKRDKNETKKGGIKKDDRLVKRNEINKKKTLSKATSLGKKSLSPGKKSGGTPPITSKSIATKTSAKHGKSPPRRNRSISPHSARERDKDKDKDRGKDKDREKDRDKERDKERDRGRGRSRSPIKKARSRTPRRHGSSSKDPRRKDSAERSRPVSPKKQVRRDASVDRHRKRSISRDRDRGRDYKDRSLERRKDEKDRHDRKDRGRDRNKDGKREDVKRRGRDRGLGGRGGADKGLEKPNKPMERLLPRPEERLAALAAISNRALETDKNSSNSKERQDTHSERGGRNLERLDRDRSSKRDRMDSLDRDQGDYDINIDRQYDHGHNLEHYDRIDDRYEGVSRDDDRSPGYLQGRERHYDPGYDPRGPYPEDDDRMYGEGMGDHRGVDMGYDDRRPHRDRSWEGRCGSMDRERGYLHPHKEWDNEDYRGSGDWGRERHWPMHDPQMGEWGDKDPEMEGWHHRRHQPRGRMHDDYSRGVRMDHARNDKRRAQRNEPESSTKDPAPVPQQANAPPEEDDADDKPIPDDLSEISDDPDDILEREDMIEQNADEESQPAQTAEDSSKSEVVEKNSGQDVSGAGEEKESQEGKDDEDTNLDFEEISDGELEEERTRAGLGDALGVDWASLVADVRRREQTAATGDARDRWRPERVLARLGLSLDMAGKETVQSILSKNSQTIKETKATDSKATDSQSEQANGEKPVMTNGKCEEDKHEAPKSPTPPDVNDMHPVAAIQVAQDKRKRQRAVLFGTGCEITRGLSARRDLALRRYLCNLPPSERSGQSRVAPQTSLFQAARALLLQAPASG